MLVLPLFRPRQWAPLEQEEGEEGEMVAMVQLVRPFGSPPFTDDDTYLAELLAPHLAHALSRTAFESRCTAPIQPQECLIVERNALFFHASPITKSAMYAELSLIEASRKAGGPNTILSRCGVQ